MSTEIIGHLSPVWSRIADILVDHAEGAYLYAGDGDRYLDFACSIGVTSTGHCRSQVIAAIREEAGKLIHGQANIVCHQPMLDLVAELLPIVPAGLNSMFFYQASLPARIWRAGGRWALTGERSAAMPWPVQRPWQPSA